jgi:hypothetical protein
MAKDSEMSDFYAVAEDPDPAKLDSLASTLKSLGCTIESIDANEGVIEGDAPIAKIAEIKKLPNVKYVRSVFNYVAETPTEDDEEEIPR